MTVVNIDLLRNPANWIIVWSMIAIGLLALSLLNQVELPEKL